MYILCGLGYYTERIEYFKSNITSEDLGFEYVLQLNNMSDIMRVRLFGKRYNITRRHL